MTTVPTNVRDLLSAEMEAELPEAWIRCADMWHKRLGRSGDEHKRRCLLAAEVAAEEEPEVLPQIAKDWMRLFPFDGEPEARRILLAITDYYEPIASLIDDRACRFPSRPARPV